MHNYFYIKYIKKLMIDRWKKKKSKEADAAERYGEV